MSAFNTPGSSVDLLTNEIYNYIQFVQEAYEKLAKTTETKLTYDAFYAILATSIIENQTSDSNTYKDGDGNRITRLSIYNNEKKLVKILIRTEILTNMKKSLALELCSLMTLYTKSKEIENALNREQEKGLKRIIVGIAILFVILIISLLLGGYVGAKPYFPTKIMKGVQVFSIYAIVLTIVSILMNVLMVNIRYQLKAIQTTTRQVNKRFRIFESFMFDAPNQVSYSAKINDVLSTIDKIRETPTKANSIKTSLTKKYFGKGEKFTEIVMNEDQKKAYRIELSTVNKETNSLADPLQTKNYLDKLLTLSEDDQIDLLLVNYILKIIRNIHSDGMGVARLALTLNKSDPLRILEGTNEILDNYYKLMLKSYQSPDDGLSHEAILRILDNTVIKNLKRFEFSDEKSYSNEEVVQKLDESIHFSLLKDGFKHLLVYMYLPWKVVNYKKLMKYSLPDSKVSQSYIEELSETDKKYLDKFMSNDAAASEIRNLYPLLRSNYVDELRLIEQYSNSISTETQKQTVDDFISFSVSKFNDVYDAQNNVYFTGIQDANDSTKNQAFSDYIAFFNPYFDKLFNDVIELTLMKLNPDKNQFFIYDTQFMRDIIENIVDNNSILKKTEANYRFYMTEALLNIIVKEQKTRFVTKYFDFGAEGNTNKSVKSEYISKQVVEITKVLASAIAPYQIKTSNYNKYIYQKVFEGNKENPFLSSLIENILLQIDFEAALIRKMKPSSNNEDETRFVPPENFMSAINSFKFSTLIGSLRVDDLQEIVNALDFEQTGMFLDQEKSITIAKLMLTGAILISIFGYILYLTLTHTTFPDVAGLRDVDPVKAFQKLDDETLRSANTTIIRELLISGLPLAMISLFIAIFSSFLIKRQTNLKFNKERITQNTSSIKSNIDKLKTLLNNIQANIKVEDRSMAIKDLNSFTDDDKYKMYTLMKKILISYDKCNYIIGANKGNLPFPYAEVFADGLLICIILGTIIYILMKFAPVERLTELKDLYEYKESAQTLVNDPTFIKEISTKFACHTDNVDSILMTVKLVFATSIIVFMFLYTVRVVNSTNMYRVGLYNSKYFQKSKCC